MGRPPILSDVHPWEGLVRARTELGPDSVEALRQLIQEWSLVADLGFSDLVAFVRTWDAAGWIAIAHVRPSTSATVFTDDPVGAFVPRSRARAMERAWQSGERIRATSLTALEATAPGRLTDPLEAVPVKRNGHVCAVIGRYSTIDRRRIGEMERNYLAACDALLGMVRRGEFPGAASGSMGAAGPRVGDGMIRVDAAGAVQYASPNARTCLRRLGVSEPVLGEPLAQMFARVGRKYPASDAGAVSVAAGREAGEAELATGTATVVFRSIPLTDAAGAGGNAGAVVLLRDVTEVRTSERALVSKDATIREIHHRVKNNLQTVGALLRLQSRRLPPGASRTALLDAVARVGTIAMVHESLARSPGEQVDFDEIFSRILRMAHDTGAAQEHDPPEVTLSGGFGVLPSDIATPLAMVLSEVLLNAMEHSRATRVRVVGRRTTSAIEVEVWDNGSGFDPSRTDGLGLRIVETLVADQLHGQLAIISESGRPWPGRLDPDPWSDRLEPTNPGSGTTVRLVCPT